MNLRTALALLAILPNLLSCHANETAMSPEAKLPALMPDVPAGAEVITLGGGCFWCIEAAYDQVDGILSATSGYMGGDLENPTYEDICSGTSGHAEVVHVVFDPQKISLARVLDWFWEMHDPTTLNRQGNDIGTQYRSAIFYQNDEQKKIAEASKLATAKELGVPVVTEITAASRFYPAENYHQNYYRENKSKNPYCRFVISPKLRKLELDP